MFRNYHYLNGSLGAGVRCYTAVYQNKPVAFIAIIHTKMKIDYFRVSRLVVLPDYQGIGLGKRLLNFIAKLYTSQINLPFYLVTSNPQLIRCNLDHWRIKRVRHGSHDKENTRINRELLNSNSRRRLSVSMIYYPSQNQR
jgi:GNAT superfamily N-acetyltransferase